MERLAGLEVCGKDARGLVVTFEAAADGGEEGAEDESIELDFRSSVDRSFAATSLYALRARSKSISQPKAETVRILATTYNMGDCGPPEDLTPWLGPGGAESEHDLVVIGVQECDYPGAADLYFKSIKDHFGDEFVALESLSLTTIRLIALVKRKHRFKISNIDTSKEATGIAGVYGNKGGVAISFNWLSQRLCFINSHLAAHQEKVAERNRDFRSILDGLSLPETLTAGPEFAFDHVFWVGDLNYRIDMEREAVVKHAEKGKLKALWEADQLRQEMEKGTVFAGWKEMGTPADNFPPTYRYTRGVEPRVYNDEKARVPSWCDRILYHSLPGTRPVTVKEYSAYNGFLASDHNPVVAKVELGVRLPAVRNTRTPDGEATVALMPVIVIESLKATEPLMSMDVNGSSDPYVVFSGAALDPPKLPATAVKKKDLEPEWEAAEIPALFPSTTDAAFLKKSALVLSVCDRDRGKSDERMGSGAIQLLHAMGTEPLEFELPLRHNGKPAGKLTGSVHVSWRSVEDAAALFEESRRKKLMRSATFLGNSGKGERTVHSMQDMTKIDHRTSLHITGVGLAKSSKVPADQAMYHTLRVEQHEMAKAREEAAALEEGAEQAASPVDSSETKKAGPLRRLKRALSSENFAKVVPKSERGTSSPTPPSGVSPLLREASDASMATADGGRRGSRSKKGKKKTGEKGSSSRKNSTSNVKGTPSRKNSSNEL